MSDYYDPRQRFVTDLELHQTTLDARQNQIHTMMPGKIVSYDPGTLTAVVQPSVQAVMQNPDGTTKNITLPKVHDVPVHFPGGGGFTLAFPVRGGDDCMLVFAERSIDHWWQLGELHPPNDYRMHDLNDAICQVGVRSQPNVPGGASSRLRSSGPTFSAQTVQLRSDDATMMMEFDPGAHTVRVISPTAIVLDTPTVTITGVLDVTNTKGTGNVGTFNGTLHVTQDVIADIDVLGGGISSVNHIHSGVVSGGANTAKPVPGS